MTLQMNKSREISIQKDVSENNDKYSTFKYSLRCNECFWNVSFYEASGSICLDSHRMSCPFCKHRKIRWIKSSLYYA